MNKDYANMCKTDVKDFTNNKYLLRKINVLTLR